MLENLLWEPANGRNMLVGLLESARLVNPLTCGLDASWRNLSRGRAKRFLFILVNILKRLAIVIG